MIMVFPGSFDPVTNGHIDVIKRGAALADKLVVAVLINREKEPLFTLGQRMDFLRMAVGGMDNVVVDQFDGLLADYCKQVGADCILRGVRAGDFDSEYVNANINRMISGVETLLLPSSPEHAFLSSSAVRDIALHGGSVSKLTHGRVATRIVKILNKNKKK